MIDKTRIRHDEYLRHEEILYWVKLHPTAHWIAIDDLPMPQLGVHYINTASDTGLTEADMRKAIAALEL